MLDAIRRYLAQLLVGKPKPASVEPIRRGRGRPPSPTTYVGRTFGPYVVLENLGRRKNNSYLLVQTTCCGKKMQRASSTIYYAKKHGNKRCSDCARSKTAT